MKVSEVLTRIVNKKKYAPYMNNTIINFVLCRVY
jgi:hypothetical protein